MQNIIGKVQMFNEEQAYFCSSVLPMNINPRMHATYRSQS
jgi:hypothetical protein